MATVAVIDYGMGNLHSIEKALKTASPNATVIVTADKNTILSADHVVFPGVGAIRDCMAALQKTGLDDIIKQVAQSFHQEHMMNRGMLLKFHTWGGMKLITQIKTHFLII